MTFIVNHDGVVYQKDLGQHTSEICAGDDGIRPRQRMEKG